MAASSPLNPASPTWCTATLTASPASSSTSEGGSEGRLTWPAHGLEDGPEVAVSENH
jgi:hypothetical protein